MSKKPIQEIDESAYSPSYRNSITISGLSGIKFRAIVKLQSEYNISLAKFIKICINALLTDNELMMQFLNSWRNDKQISAELKNRNKKTQLEIADIKQKFDINKEKYEELFDRFFILHEEDDDL